jgi:hypothetical protein
LCLRTYQASSPQSLNGINAVSLTIQFPFDSSKSTAPPSDASNSSASASALLRGPELLAQLIFTPLLAGWSIWVGIGISARSSDVRVAQQLGMLASLPSVAVTSLIAFNVIPATLGLAVGSAAALLLLNRLGWRITLATPRPRTAHHRHQVMRCEHLSPHKPSVRPGRRLLAGVSSRHHKALKRGRGTGK